RGPRRRHLHRLRPRHRQARRVPPERRHRRRPRHAAREQRQGLRATGLRRSEALRRDGDERPLRLRDVGGQRLALPDRGRVRSRVVSQATPPARGLTRRALAEYAAAGALAVGLGLREPRRAQAAAPARDPAIIGSWGGLQIPATGAYFGADDTTRGFTTANGIETQLGRRMGFRNRRYGWLAKCPSAAATADSKLSAPGVIPMTSFG